MGELKSKLIDYLISKLDKGQVLSDSDVELIKVLMK